MISSFMWRPLFGAPLNWASASIRTLPTTL
jgi:hypothetical protein